MSKGTPSLHSLVHRGWSLLKTILFCLRVMTISEYFPNESEMNDETPQICKNDSFRGALSPRGTLLYRQTDKDCQRYYSNYEKAISLGFSSDQT